MKRYANIIFCSMFFLMLLIPLLLTNIKEGAISDVDGRALVSMPVFGTNEYTSEVEAWLRDRLGLCDEIINAYSVSNYKMFNELNSTTYQYGQEGHFFFKIHSNVEYGDYQKQFADMVLDIQEYCESRGTKFYYVFYPEKEKVYKKYLPKGINYSDEWADKMLSYMDRQGINCVDLREPLIEISHDTDVFNEKYDTDHLNYNGVYNAMEILTERIHDDIPTVKPLGKDEFDISTMIAEKVFDSNQLFNEEVPLYTFKEECIDKTGDLELELLRSQTWPYFQLVQNNSVKASGIKRLLLFEDNIYGAFAFTRSKETAILACLENVVNFDYFYNVFKPDVVIFENMEYTVSDTYFSQTSMKTTEHNPAIIRNYPEEDFGDRKKALLENSKVFDTDAAAVIVNGKEIDRVFINRKINNSRYAYLITNSRTIDLKQSDDGSLTASIRHKDLTSGSEVVLFYLDDEGVGHYSMIPVISELKDISGTGDLTSGVNYNKITNSYSFNTEIKDNKFSSSAIQLMDSDMKGYYGCISEYSIGKGKLEGVYCHNLESGVYSVILRCSANYNDEYITYRVPLKKGRVYWYSYTKEEFSEKQIIVKDFSFSECE